MEMGGSLVRKNCKVSAAKENKLNFINHAMIGNSDYEYQPILNKSKASVKEMHKQQHQNASLNLKINNMKFDRLASNYVKKRDRYKQIFGDKPKYVYKKIGGEERISEIPFIRMR